MTAKAESRRREERKAFDGIVTLSITAEGADQKFYRGRAIDFSKSGARIHLPEPVEVGVQVYLRADSFGLMGMAKVRYCQHRLAGYVLGLELENRGTAMRTPDDFIDYYEVLQISPKADNETIHRVFRMQAARYHPDNKQTGNAERFRMLTRIYETLVDSKSVSNMTCAGNCVNPGPFRSSGWRNLSRGSRARSTAGWGFYACFTNGAGRTPIIPLFRCFNSNF